MKIASDNSDIEVMVTRGVEGRPPDIWLRWLSVEANPMIVRITIEEARAIAAKLLFESLRALENSDV